MPKNTKELRNIYDDLLNTLVDFVDKSNAKSILIPAPFSLGISIKKISLKIKATSKTACRLFYFI